MTVPANNRRITHAGNGVTTVFNGPMAASQSQIQAFLVEDATGTVSSAGSFTVTQVNKPAGTRVTMTTPPPLNYTLVLLRVVPYSQGTDITNQGPYNASTLEDGLDAIVYQTQQLGDDVSRTPRLGDGEIDGQGRYDANGNRLGDLADGVEASDAVTVGQVTSLISIPTGPFIQAGTGADPRSMQDKARESVTLLDFIPEAQHAAILDGTTVYNATADLQAAIDSGADTVTISRGLYRIGSTISITGKTGFTLIGDGGTIYADGSFTALSITNCNGLRTKGELNITGAAGATGFSMSTNVNCQFVGFRVFNIALGGILGTPQNKNYGGIVVPDQTRVEGFTIIQCGVGIRVDGEYYELASPHIMGCTSYGLHVRGGNFVGTGGIVNGNRIGVFVEGGVIGNSDHGRIAGMSINHNLAAGIYCKDVALGFQFVGCGIWATIGDGTANGQLTEAGRTTSFGVYLQNANSVDMAGSTIARSRVNVGIDGACLCDLASGVTYDADPTRTTDHILEYGANNTTYGANAQNNYQRGATVMGTLSGSHQQRFITLQTTSSIANDGGGSRGTTGQNNDFFDGSTTGTVVWEGKGDGFTLLSGCPATIRVSPALFQREFWIQFVSTAGASKVVEIMNANGLSSYATSALSISGANVTLKANMLYHFKPYGNGLWHISTSGGNEAPQVIGSGGAPAFQNAWTALATFEPPRFYKDASGDIIVEGVLATTGASNAIAFTLPTGYRPAAIVAAPMATGASLTGFLRIETNGDVKPNYEATATFCAMKTRFRPV